MEKKQIMYGIYCSEANIFEEYTYLIKTFYTKKYAEQICSKLNNEIDDEIENNSVSYFVEQISE